MPQNETQQTAQPQPAPPISDSFDFEVGEPAGSQDDLATLKTVPHKVLADNLDLRHQVSVPASQIATLQTGMNAQLGGMSGQVASLSQQIARTNSRMNPHTENPAD